MIAELKTLAAMIGVLCVLGALMPSTGSSCHYEKTCPHNPPTIAVALTLPLSGPEQPIGESMLRGYRLWAEMVNRAGGIRGNKVQLEVRDDAAERDKVLTHVTEFAANEKVDVIFGPRTRAPL